MTVAHAEPHPGSFPTTVEELLARLGALHGLDAELGPARRALTALPIVPVETSVSLGPRSLGELRATVGVAPRADDPDGRATLVNALSAVAADHAVREVDEALASVAPAAGTRRLPRGIALRARAGDGDGVRMRPGTWVRGGAAGIADAMRRVGLDEAAALHGRLAAQLAANPFNAVGAYAFGVDLGASAVLGAKTYFTCEWADVALAFLRDRAAPMLDLAGADAFALLAECVAPRNARWLLEISFELPSDPAAGVRAKAYVPARKLAASELEADGKVRALAARLDLDIAPYERLLTAMRPDGLSAARACSVMLGMSATQRHPTLEIYLS